MFVFCLNMVSKACSDSLKVTGDDQKELCSKKCQPKEEATGPRSAFVAMLSPFTV